MLQKALRDEEPILLHSPSDDSLFDDLQQVARAEPGMVSKSVAYRNKNDRSEILRILGHLPMVKEARTQRVRGVPRQRCETPQTARERPQSRADERLTPRAASYMRPPSAGSMVRQVKSPTAQAPHTHRAPRAATPRRPRNAWDGPREERRSATPVSAPLSEPNAWEEPRPDAKARAVASPSPEPEISAERGRPMPGREAWFAQAVQTATAGARLGFSAPPAEDDAPMVSEEEVEQVKKRYLHKLAEVGVDPKGKTAGQILQTLYARGSRTESQRMNAEAQKKVPQTV